MKSAIRFIRAGVRVRPKSGEAHLLIVMARCLSLNDCSARGFLMKATVKVANPKRGMFGVETEDGEFVIFELLDSDEPEIGDVVSHPDFHSLGEEHYNNLTQGITISVLAQNI